jgi:hypothetical protein
MGPAKADHADGSVAVRSGEAMGLSIDHAVKTEARLGETTIFDIGQYFQIDRPGERTPCLARLIASLSGSNSIFIGYYLYIQLFYCQARKEKGAANGSPFQIRE